jgi:hypothetical protein
MALNQMLHTPDRRAHRLFAQKCPFEAINIINLPTNLERDTSHRYSANSFKLHRYGRCLFSWCNRAKLVDSAWRRCSDGGEGGLLS